MKSLSLFLYFFVFSFALQAQDSLTYKQDFRNLMNIRLFAITNFNRFEIAQRNNSQSLVKYSPNENLNIGLSVNYKWFGFGAAFNLPFVNDDNGIKGKTRQMDMQLRVFSQKFGGDVYMQHYSGYYVRNPTSVMPSWHEGLPYPQRPDIRTTAMGAFLFYAFNHKRFSIRAAFLQTEKQLHSVGSWVIVPHIAYYRLLGDSTIVPSNLQETYNNRNLLTKGNFYSLGLSGGYIYSLVNKKGFFATISAVGGFVSNYRMYEMENSSENISGIQLAISAGSTITLAYNGKHLFGGAGAMLNIYGFKINDNFLLNYQIGSVRIFVGMRLNVEKAFKTKKLKDIWDY